ncbi:hypothetical protein HY792_04595 [Candidatus Desantisbacteria bacterium]|nr:hypothetical protein [Candidatus Desantisbacteria bacterium]
MKKLLVSVVAVALAGGVAYAADMQQEDATVGLNCLQLIELTGIDMSETVTPGPEDYARDLEVSAVMNDQGLKINNTGFDSATENVMADANDDIGKGFAERTAALEMTIFTNAQDGAALFVHGLQPATQQNILRLEDTYVAVCTEKTYILVNNIEGAFADAASVAVLENKSTPSTTHLSNSNVATVKDNPRDDNFGGVTIEKLGSSSTDRDHVVDYVTESNPTIKAASTYLRIHNQAQHLFEVKMATKAPRLVVINLGIANLARYTEGEYTNTLTFTLMPIVG